MDTSIDKSMDVYIYIYISLYIYSWIYIYIVCVGIWGMQPVSIGPAYLFAGTSLSFCICFSLFYLVSPLFSFLCLLSSLLFLSSLLSSCATVWLSCCHFLSCSALGPRFHTLEKTQYVAQYVTDKAN